MNRIFEKDVDFKSLSESLQSGKIMVYPTETCYGIGCDATNEKAIKKIFDLKGRKENKPVLLLFKDVETVQSFVEWTPLAQTLASKFWPGPLTLVFSLKPGKHFPPGVLGEQNTIAARVSSFPFIQKCFEYFSYPIVSTSANLSGDPSSYLSTDVMQSFFESEIPLDIFIDAGTLPINPPSTIIDVRSSSPKILRQGSIMLST